VKTVRKSYTETNKIYFFTTTIYKWLPLFNDSENKALKIAYFKEL